MPERHAGDQTVRPSPSRQVPKFSACRSPTQAIRGPSSSGTSPSIRFEPAVVRRAEEHKRVLAHALVRLLEILGYELDLQPEPALVPLGRFDDVLHGENLTLTRSRSLRASELACALKARPRTATHIAIASVMTCLGEKRCLIRRSPCGDGIHHPPIRAVASV
jgi:hypothetical protein